MKMTAVPSALRLIDDEQGPDIARLMIDAGKALDGCCILQDQEDRMVQIPGDLLVGDMARVCQSVLSRAMPDLVDARQIGMGCGA